MGIGAAFATGLIKGFTQNIEKEEARRLAEQAKVDRIEELAIQASFDPKKDTSGIFPLIKSARQKFSEREPIDMFGRATDGIDLDLAKMQGAITKASAYESKVGRFGFNVDVRKFSSLGDSYGAIADMNSQLLGNTKNRNMLLEAEDAEVAGLQSLYTAHASRILNDFAKSKQGGKEIKIDTSILKGIQEFDTIMRQRTGDENYSTLNRAYGENNGKPAHVSPTNPTDVIVASGFGEYEAGYNTLGNSLRTDFENLPNVWAKYTEQTGMATKSERQSWFNAARDIAKDFSDKGLVFPTKSLAVSSMTQENAATLLNTIVEKTNGSAIGAAYVFGAFQEVENWDPDTNFDYVDESISDRLFSARELFGQTAKESDYGKIEAANMELTEVLGTEGGDTGIYGLLNMAETEFDAPVVLDSIKGKLASVGAIFTALADNSTKITRSTVSAFAPTADIRSDSEAAALKGRIDPETGETYKFLTDSFVLGLNNNIEMARERGKLNRKEGETLEQAGARYAAFEALRISLAFQMARAADPSGRLSNQDIENQLTRLGQNFDTPAAMKARLRVAISDFEIKKARYSAIIETVGTGSGKATVASKKLIKGIVGIDRLSKKALGGQGSFAQYIESADGTMAPAYDPPTGQAPSKQYISIDGRPVFPALSGGIPVTDNDGGNIYIDVEGNPVEVKAQQSSQTVQPSASVAPAQSAAPQGQGTGSLPETNIQRNESTAAPVVESPQPAPQNAPTGSIDPKTVEPTGGNTMSGFTLRNKETKEVLSGTYKVVNGRYVLIKMGV
jgi:hypothetical protein